MIAVMLRPGHVSGQFRRSVRDGKGKVLRTLRFEAGKPQELGDDDFAAVMGDVGVALVYAKVDENGNVLPKPDWEATEADKPKPKK